MNRVVIVGAGLAGYTLAKEIRKLDSQIALHIITKDEGDFYSKPMLSNALAKNKKVDDLITTSARDMAAQLNATLWNNSSVKNIDATKRIVSTADQSVNYDALVLAVGASQITPLIKGGAADAVLTINSIQDYARFRLVLEKAKHVAILGPGLIGCEFANDIVETGRQVTVIGPGKTPLDRLIPEQAGKSLQNKLSELGIMWRLGVTADSVEFHNGTYSLTLSNGEVVQADLVISAIGLKPNTELAQLAGARINRGIVVGRFLETSIKDIYALGDCAEIEGMVLPFVLPIMHSARALAQTLTGKPKAVNFPAMPVVVKTPAHSIVVSSPASGSPGEWLTTVEEGGVRGLFQNSENKLLGFVLTGAFTSEKQKLTKELPPVLE